MKNLILILFFAFLGCQNSDAVRTSKTDAQTVTDSDIYEIVNLVLSENDVALKHDGFNVNPYKYILDKDLAPLFSHYDSIAFIKTDSIFTKQDLIFIQQQINERKNFKFQSDSIKSKKIIQSGVIEKMLVDKLKTGKDFYKSYFEKFGSDMYYTIGLPVFSKDKKTVYIKIDSFGHGQTAIYKKINGKWKYYCAGSNWIA